MSNNLPRTRMALLKDILHYRFFDVVYASLYMLLFFLPAVMWLVFVNYSPLSIFDNIYNPLIVYGVLAILIALGGPGVGGAFYFFKKLVYSEGSNIHRDFFTGLKENYRFYFLAFLVIGASYGILHFGSVVFYLDQNISQTVSTILIGVMYGGLLLIINATLFASAEQVIYINTYSRALLNGFKFVIGDFFRSFGLLLLTLIPFFIYEFVSSFIMEWVSIGVYGLFYFGFSVLLFTLYTHSVFDKTINKKYYADLIRKGLSDE